VTLRVWAAAKDVPVRLKVEDAANPNHSVETEAKTTVANAWQTLSFDFRKPAAGTPPLNLSYSYNKATVFFNFGKTGAQGGGGTFYFDDPILIGDDGSKTALVAFENKPVVTGFGGAEDSTIVSTGVADNVLKVIRDHKLDIKMQLGAYILSESSPYISDAVREEHRVHNRAEVQRAIKLAKEFKEIVLAVSIGNETMIYWSFVPSSPEIMAAYIAEVRGQIEQPVTTNDNWFFWANAPKIITDIVDFASLHTYCELDTVFDPNKPISTLWKQGQVDPSARAAAMMDAIIACAKEDYQAARDWLDKKGQAIMPIVIGETGWNAVNLGALTFRAHPVNQKMYFQALQQWKQQSVGGKGPVNVIYFEAFDEPWKGSDDRWGLFNVQRQARYVVQNLYPQSLWEPVNAANDADGDGKYTTADATHWVPMSNDMVTANRYTLYAENYTLNEARPATPTLWNAWENGTSATAASIDCTKPPPVATPCTPPPDGITSLQITPQPLVWGWGIALNLKESDLKTDASADLSAFAGGTLNFSVRSTYPGLIEVGFYTWRSADQSGYDAYVLLASGQYGFVNDGHWHQVSIPLSAILAVAPKADLSKVTSPFVIADRYEKTGKAQKSDIRTKIEVDAIYWAR
jgi:exo-beta-1,3-glucanase (GH17 family)